MQNKLFSGVIAAAILIIIGSLFVIRRSSTPQSSPSGEGRLRVVATFFPLYDFTKAVGKDTIELTLLFTQTPEVASFAPADVQKINNADLVIKNGLGFEPILDEIIAASDNKAVAVVDTSAFIALLGSDPHIWLNPRNAVIQVEHIRDALVSHDPANAAFYRANAAAYITELERLDREIESQVARFRRNDFIAFHSAFRYFADRYGLRQVAVIEESPGKEPSPRYVAEVIKIIRDTGVKAIFSEPQFSPRVLEAIAHDTGLTVYALDPIETGDPEHDSYVSVMRRNREILKRAMQ